MFEIKDPKLNKIIAMAKGTQYAVKAYPQVVEYLIQQRYTISQELSLNRQRDTKVDEWNEYNQYCEDAKAYAKEILEMN